jgi:hypothetical protein
MTGMAGQTAVRRVGGRCKGDGRATDLPSTNCAANFFMSFGVHGRTPDCVRGRVVGREVVSAPAPRTLSVNSMVGLAELRQIWTVLTLLPQRHGARRGHYGRPRSQIARDDAERTTF